MNADTCYCRNRDCRAYGRSGKLSRLKFFDWHRGVPRFRCQVCRFLVSARTGTAYARIRMDETTYRYAVTALAEGLALRAVGRMFGLDKDTLCNWLPRLGEHCETMMSYFFRDLHLSECQLDKCWTFVYKKEDQLDPIEQLLSV